VCEVVGNFGVVAGLGVRSVFSCMALRATASGGFGLDSFQSPVCGLWTRSTASVSSWFLCGRGYKREMILVVKWFIHQREGKTYYFMTQLIAWGVQTIGKAVLNEMSKEFDDFILLHLDKCLDVHLYAR
jgi:hypothetical protein